MDGWIVITVGALVAGLQLVIIGVGCVLVGEIRKAAKHLGRTVDCVTYATNEEARDLYGILHDLREVAQEIRDRDDR